MELTVMPEEYKTLGRFAEVVEQILQEQRNEARAHLPART